MVDRPPQIEMTGVIKRYQALRPLRVGHLVARTGDRIALEGIDAAAAELFVNLVTGAAVPDEGDVIVAGRNTRDIETDTDWLTSLDRFGIVTERAVLLEGLTVAANLALPLTLSIDPMSDEVRRQVEAVANEVQLGVELSARIGSLSPEQRVRVHLARALAMAPELLLLEHPTARLESPQSTSFGELLATISNARGLGWISMTADQAFARASGGRRMRLDAASGDIRDVGFWRGMWRG